MSERYVNAVLTGLDEDGQFYTVTFQRPAMLAFVGVDFDGVESKEDGCVVYMADAKDGEDECFCLISLKPGPLQMNLLRTLGRRNDG